jgi:hypothetical protein
VRNPTTHQKFAVAEVFRRLRAVKRLLLNKNQCLLYEAEIPRLEINLPSEDSFYLRPDAFNDKLFLSVITANRQLFDKSNFKHQDLQAYCSLRSRDLIRPFSITAMLFTKYRRQHIFEKHVIICLGSLYHAPRIFYRDEKTKKVVYEKVTDYIDLF